MNAKEILAGLAKLSPAIGTMLGGPVGGAIGTGIAAVAATVTGESDPDKILQTLHADPDKLLEIEAMAKQMEVEQQRLHSADRESARDMQARLAETKHGSAWASSIISAIVTVGFFLMLYTVLGLESGSLPDVAYIMLGSLAAGFTQVLNYWLGSSKGSSEKTNLMASFVKRY